MSNTNEDLIICFVQTITYKLLPTTSNPDDDLGVCFESLGGLLVHKLNNTHPAWNDLTPDRAAAVNRWILHDLQAIRRHSDYPLISDAFKKFFTELKGLAIGWERDKEGCGTSQDERDRLKLLMQKLAES